MRPLIGFLVLFIWLSGSQCCAQTAFQADDSLRILTWNIFMISPIAPRQSQRAEAIGKVLAQGEYDVIVLQEAFRNNRIAQIKKYVDSIYPYQVLPKKKKAIYSSGVWILSKLPFLETQAILFKKRLHFDRFADKGAVRVRVQKGDFKLDVIGSHTQAMVRPKHSDVREAQYSRIRDCLYRNDSVPVLVIGDLNTPKKPVDRYGNMLEILGAKDGPVLVPKETLVSDTLCYTWGCVYNDLTPKDSRGDVGLYDYALIRENGADVHVDRTLRIDQGTNEKGEFNLSDHYAIDVLIKF